MNCFSSLLMVFIFVSTHLFAAKYKVKSIAEFNDVMKKVNPGDQIIMANGHWEDAKVLFKANGTAEKPIKLKAETPGEVILSGSSSLRIAGDHLIVDGLYFKNGYVSEGSVIEFRKNGTETSTNCRLTNTVIVDYNPPDKTTENKWVSLYGTNNRVDHCYFRNKTNLGCLLVVWLSDKPNYHLIDSNYFAYRPKLGVNGAEIIRVGTSEWSMHPSYTTAEDNFFEQCNGEREIISNKSLYNTYRHNTFVECQGTLTLRHGNYCMVEGNYIFGNNVKGTGGIRIIGEGHKVFNNYIADTKGTGVYSAISLMNGVPNSPANRYFQVKDAVVAFNTLINNKNSIEIGAGKDEEISLPPINSTIANNVVYSTQGKLITETAVPQNFKWEGNILFGSEPGLKETEGIANIDPKLEKGTDGLWCPISSSPVIKSAKGAYDFVNVDIDGQIRTVPKDVGCDQISNQPVKLKPIYASDVGPNWLKRILEDKLN